ncbi:hypothetical protein F7R91_27370 [Streptomyces luteolifulvus]|uniref:Uncharacterized protein n=1 Tax=Streptomyces luteolifulvus TaxID=2615112 RepID=A0A6H9UUQ2_9ACTN|nr:hypothetical protein [Streptomyces luteolifulvus]KAB1142831.1 hypothetical protein F7R91_27370 [Streptomyces luteolifulvus]
MSGRAVRWGAVLGFGALWWWAVLRLALAPDAGVLEAAVAAGGWGLSLLPVHCVPKDRAVGAVGAGRWAEAWRAAAGPTRARPAGARTTRAWPRRRSDAGSDRS